MLAWNKGILANTFIKKVSLNKGDDMKKLLFALVVICGGTVFAAEKVEPVSVTASSTLVDSKNAARYSVNNLMDGKNDSWVEGDKGDGTGAYVTFDFGKQVELTEIVIRNGYGDLKYWEQNNRVKELGFSFDGIGGVSVKLFDNPGYQLIQFKYPEPVRKLTMSIESVYKGSKYEDTAIAEVSFNNWDYYADKFKWGWGENDLQKSIYEMYANNAADFYTEFAKKKFNHEIYRAVHRDDDEDCHEDAVSNMRYNVIPVRDGSLVVSWSLPGSVVSGFKGDKNSETFLERLTKLNERIKTAKKLNEPFDMDEYDKYLNNEDDLDIFGKNADPVMKEFLIPVDSDRENENSTFEYMPEYFYTYEVGWK